MTASAAQQFPSKLAEMEEFVCADPVVLAPRIRHPLLRRLLEDWRALSSDARLPSRNQFSPEQLRYVLGNLIIWDVQTEPLVAIYRLYGSNLAARRSGELTGKRLDELPDPVMRSMALHGLQRVVGDRKPLLSRGLYRRDGEVMMSMETLTLPLAADGQNVDMILHGQFNEFLGYDDGRTSAAAKVQLQCVPAEQLQVHVEHPRLARLLQDWNSWRGERRVPSRADFGPEKLDYLLGNLFLFDILPPLAEGAMPRFRYRLFGSSIAGFRGFDLTGRCVDEHPDGAFAARAQLAYAQAASQRLPLWAKVDGIGSSGLVSRFEALALPLGSDGASPDMMLAAQIMTGA